MKTLRYLAIPVAALMAAAVGQPAAAEEEAVKGLISPNTSTIEIGIVGAVDEPSSAGKFIGLSDMDALPIASGSYIRRDEETGTWMRVEGTDLGLDSRSLRFEYERQGDWKAYVDLGQITKDDPLNFFTTVTASSGNIHDPNGTAQREIHLSKTRRNVKTGFSKRFDKATDVQLSYRAEYKDGE